MPFDPSVLSNLMLVLTGFGAAFAVSLWISLIIWTSRDIRSRTRDPLVRILAVFLPTVLFLPGILIYLILRPAHTLDEEYERALEEESLLAAIEDAALCPGCNRRVQTDWVICPGCHTRLKKACEECGKPIDLAWDLCPFCGAPTADAQIEETGELEPLLPAEEAPLPEMEAEGLPEESGALSSTDESPEVSNPL
jgi:RNA polymerase subunit RPABC4/transcription elongation factor Spt4